jgi:hypothetical protein
VAGPGLQYWRYAAFFCSDRIFAHLARWAMAILFRAAADMVCLAEEKLVFGVAADSLRTFAHLAFCASAIFLREAAEIIRFGWVALRDVRDPFNDSMTEIA